ncbi:hypothetical protein [Kitasatospora sp. NBC_01539]|uniref:hypothetical protein n=1 Tax=Kitasatospora sp. NBC_01539 TaxID=2903577 RepID=UPI0038601212
MTTFRWTCLAVAWALGIAGGAPAVIRGWVPRWLRPVGAPRIWGAGQLVIMAGITFGVVTGSSSLSVWPVGPLLVGAGLVLQEWARRRTPRKPV